jgi:hypothetical protein
MNKNFSSLFIITVFLSMQALSLLHATEYGFEKHEHNGKICDIFLSADHNKLLGSVSAKLIAPNLLTFKITLLKKELSFLYKSHSFDSRAPPLFS